MSRIITGTYGTLEIPNQIAYVGDNIYFKYITEPQLGSQYTNITMVVTVNNKVFTATINTDGGDSRDVIIDVTRFVDITKAVKLTMKVIIEINPIGVYDDFPVYISYARKGKTLPTRHHFSEEVIYLPQDVNTVEIPAPTDTSIATSSVEEDKPISEVDGLIHLEVSDGCDDNINVEVSQPTDCLPISLWHYYVEYVQCKLRIGTGSNIWVILRPFDNTENMWGVYASVDEIEPYGYLMDDVDPEGIFGADFSQLIQIKVRYKDVNEPDEEYEDAWIVCKDNIGYDVQYRTTFVFEKQRYIFKYGIDEDYGGEALLHEVYFDASQVEGLLCLHDLYVPSIDDTYLVYDSQTSPGEYYINTEPVTSILGLLWTLQAKYTVIPDSEIGVNDKPMIFEKTYNPYQHDPNARVYFFECNMDILDSIKRATLVFTRQENRFVFARLNNQYIYDNGWYVYKEGEYFNVMTQDFETNFAPLKYGTVFEEDMDISYTVIQEPGQEANKIGILTGDCHRFWTKEGDSITKYFPNFIQIYDDRAGTIEYVAIPGISTTYTYINYYDEVHRTIKEVLEVPEGTVDEGGSYTAHEAENICNCGGRSKVKRGLVWCSTEDYSYNIALNRLNVSCNADIKTGGNSCDFIWLEYTNTDGAKRYMCGKIIERKLAVTANQYSLLYNNEINKEPRRFTESTAETITLFFQNIPQNAYFEDILLSDEIRIHVNDIYSIPCTVTDEEVVNSDNKYDYTLTIQTLI